ncbi:hypothetical protein PQY67_05135 [Pseudomonadales bacterium]|nr:hypothetical protein [Pseudomonadales bacterium]
MHQAIEQKIIQFQVASRAFKNNENVTNKLISEGASKSTSIEMAYELQAGEHTRNFNELALKRNKDIHQLINKYMDVGDVNSVGVFGVGEAKNWIGYEGSVKDFHGVGLAFPWTGNSFCLNKSDAIFIGFAEQEISSNPQATA